jgi:hypothetical protein
VGKAVVHLSIAILLGPTLGADLTWTAGGRVSHGQDGFVPDLAECPYPVPCTFPGFLAAVPRMMFLQAAVPLVRPWRVLAESSSSTVGGV